MCAATFCGVEEESKVKYAHRQLDYQSHTCAKVSYSMSRLDVGFLVQVMKRIDAVNNCTPIHVKTNTKLTNFMKLIRIEGYNGE